MSWAQYRLIQKGYWAKYNREWEDGWQQIRELFWLGWNTNTSKSEQKSRHELIPLPSDPKPKKVSPEKQHEIFFMALHSLSTNKK